MIYRILIYFMMVLTLHGWAAGRLCLPSKPAGIPLQDVCDRYHVTWQWDGVTQVVMMEYKGNNSKALVGVFDGTYRQEADQSKRAFTP